MTRALCHYHPMALNPLFAFVLTHLTKGQVFDAFARFPLDRTSLVSQLQNWSLLLPVPLRLRSCDDLRDSRDGMI